MAKNTNRNVPVEGTHTPGSAESEHTPFAQSDRADEDIVGQSSDDDDDFEDDESEEDDEDDADDEEEEAE